MIKGFFGKSLFLGITLSFFTINAFSAEYTANPFKTPPSSLQPAMGSNNPLPADMQQALKNQQAGLGGLTNGITNEIKNDAKEELNNVTKALTDREERAQKVLNAVNGKMLKAKNVPVENARYIGIINGKRVYQDNDTREYIKVELDK